MDDILKDIANNFMEQLNILTSDENLGYFITTKRVVRRNNKKKYYSFNKRYVPGVLDYLPGAKESLYLCLKFLLKKVKK